MTRLRIQAVRLTQSLLLVADHMHLVFAERWRLVSCASHRVDPTLARWRLLILGILHKVLLQALHFSNGSALLDSKIILIILRVHVKL